MGRYSDRQMFEEKMAKLKEPGISWFEDFDKMTGGLRRKKVLLFGAPSGHGKTLMACNIVHTMEARGLRTAWITTETDADTIDERIGARGWEAIKDYKVEIFDNSKIRPSKRFTTNKCSASAYGDELFDYDVVLVDYLKTTSTEAYAGSKELRDMLDEWHIWAETNDKIVILLAQAKKWADDKKYVMSDEYDYKLSSAVYEAADYAIVAREIAHDERACTTDLAFDLIKNRRPQPPTPKKGRFILRINYFTAEIYKQSSIATDDDNAVKALVKDWLTPKDTPTEKPRRLELKDKKKTRKELDDDLHNLLSEVRGE